MALTKRSFATILALTRGIGGKTVARIVARNELLGISPEEFLSLSPEALKEEFHLGARQAAAILQAKAELHVFLDMEAKLNARGVGLILATDSHYPRLLEEFDPEAPGALFVYGNTTLLEAGNKFCVLSSRNARPAELDRIERTVEASVLEGQILVAGHDRPEYQRAAVVPLRWGVPRILCLDRGFKDVLGEDYRNEPFRAARLWRYEFDPNTDLVISPFRPDAPFRADFNKRRDKLVAGLSNRLDFVKVEEGGGMATLVQMGLKAGRKVRISDTILGYRRLLEQGAELLP